MIAKSNKEIIEIYAEQQKYVIVVCPKCGQNSKIPALEYFENKVYEFYCHNEKCKYKLQSRAFHIIPNEVTLEEIKTGKMEFVEPFKDTGIPICSFDK